MVLDNHIGQAAFYVLASFLGGLLAVALGAFLAKNC
jgi:CrcB protein